MEFWIDKIIQNNSWFRMLFLFYAILILILKLLDPIQFKFFIRPLNFNQYKRRYCIDRNFEVFNLFYLVLIFLISNSLSFIIIISNNLFFNIDIRFENYLFILFLIYGFLLTRLLLTNFINKSLNIFPDLELYTFTTIIYYGYLLIGHMILMIIIYLQDFYTIVFMKFSIIFLFVFFLISNIHFFKEYIKNSSKNILYLFYYLCAFKIAPWLWLSKAF